MKRKTGKKKKTKTTKTTKTIKKKSKAKTATKKTKTRTETRTKTKTKSMRPDDRLYTLEVFIISGPMTERYVDKNPTVSRTIQIQGIQCNIVELQLLFLLIKL